MNPFETEIETVRRYLVAQGYMPGKCEGYLTRGQEEPTLVVHFTNDDPAFQGDEKYVYHNTPSTIVGILTLRTGKISIPELF